MRLVLVILGVAGSCAAAAAAATQCTPNPVEIECTYPPQSRDVETLRLLYKGTQACMFDLIVDWNENGLQDLSCDDFYLGDGWMFPDSVDFSCAPCPGCAECESDHVHVFIKDNSGIGIGLGNCVFKIDVWEETPCGGGSTIYVFGAAYDCDDEEIFPVTWCSWDVDVE